MHHAPDGQILVFKDFTIVLEMSRDKRQAVLAQFREIYDGKFDKVWGNGQELHWEGRLGFVAGVTPAIDKHHAVMAILGPGSCNNNQTAIRLDCGPFRILSGMIRPSDSSWLSGWLGSSTHCPRRRLPCLSPPSMNWSRSPSW